MAWNLLDPTVHHHFLSLFLEDNSNKTIFCQLDCSTNVQVFFLNIYCISVHLSVSIRHIRI